MLTSSEKEDGKKPNNTIVQRTESTASKFSSVHELQKMVRRLEVEKEELQKALDEAEAALEAEEAKVKQQLE